MQDLNLNPNFEELLNDMEEQRNNRALNSVKKLSLKELADILETSNIMSTTNHAGILTHIIDHPTIGEAATVQASGNGALLIKGLLV